MNYKTNLCFTCRELEDRAQNLRSSQENRIINLEARLQELSETVGSYDRLRQQDQVDHGEN